VAIDPLFAEVARWLLVAVFAAALWHKLSDWKVFVVVVEDYRLLPGILAAPAAAAVVAGEALALLGLTAGLEKEAALLAAVLLGLYALGIAINLARGRRDIDCGCYGPAGGDAGRHRLSGWLLVRNAALVCAAAVVAAPSTGRELVWLDVVSIAAAVTAAVTIYYTADRLLANRPLIGNLVQ